jgi:hypothetical protein
LALQVQCWISAYEVATCVPRMALDTCLQLRALGKVHRTWVALLGPHLCMQLLLASQLHVSVMLARFASTPQTLIGTASDFGGRAPRPALQARGVLPGDGQGERLQPPPFGPAGRVQAAARAAHLLRCRL